MIELRRSKEALSEVRGVAAFTLLYLVAATIVGGARRNYEFLGYVVWMLVLVAVVWRVHLRVGLSRGALWGLSLWGFAHMVGGLLPAPPGWPTSGEGQVMYSVWLIPGRIKYDHVVHALGFGVTTWVCWQGLRAVLERRGDAARATTGLLLLVWAAGLGFGALNELVEFVATLLIPETNVGGYLNTGWDLVANAVGATAAVILIRWGARRREASAA